MRRATNLGVAERITPFVADASEVALCAGAFDLIVGSSMIHHLTDPDAFIDRALCSLKPNGAGLFYEPFQAGHIVLRTLLQSFVQIAALKGGLSERRLQFFRDYIFTIDTMCAAERDPAFYATLEDKYMFSTDMFRRAAKRNGCRVSVFATNPPENAFASKISDLLWQGLGEKDPLPDWAVAVVSETDAASRTAREDLLIEGCIAFTKS
jgi:hypothetical protein